MQSDRSFFEELKYRYTYGGMHMKLIFINALVFLAVGILLVIARLLGINGIGIPALLTDIFALQADFAGLLFKPWGLFTSIFAHFQFFHFLFNMLVLFFVGKLYEDFFGSKRLLSTYLLGGIAGGLFEILAHELFPGLANQAVVVVGASGSIMAIFVGLAFYRPNLEVRLFGIVPVKLILLAGLYLLYDILSLGANDNTAHFAHVGGALLGILAIQNPHSSSNFMYKIEVFFSNLFKTRPKKTKLKAEKGGRFKSDEQFNVEKKARQEKIDAILDKISKSGYESLTKAEKEMLFNQSKNG
jgi:membrane associated rhomboid family serine protease